MKFEYFVNLDERGEFFADVRNVNGKTVYEVHSDEDGTVWQVEDGYMCHARDCGGLAAYLMDCGIIPNGAKITLAN